MSVIQIIKKLIFDSHNIILSHWNAYKTENNSTVSYFIAFPIQSHFRPLRTNVELCHLVDIFPKSAAHSVRYLQQLPTHQMWECIFHLNFEYNINQFLYDTYLKPFSDAPVV